VATYQRRDGREFRVTAAPIRSLASSRQIRGSRKKTEKEDARQGRWFPHKYWRDAYTNLRTAHSKL
jgi:hypothetical protein